MTAARTGNGVIVGVDNGVSGGLCAISESGGDIISYTVMPTLERKGKKEVDVTAFKRWVDDLYSPPCIAVEEPLRHAKSSQAVRSMALNFGKILGLSESKGWPILEVEVSAWQKEMLGTVPKGQTKVFAASFAAKISGGCSFLKSERAKVPHDGIVDAYLIAVYARRNFHLF